MPRRNPTLTRVIGPYAARILELDGPWTPECASFYVQKRCDAVRWRWRTRARGATTEALLDLPGLRQVDLDLRGVDDRAVGQLTGVESITLTSDCDQTLDLGALQSLKDLSTNDRPWTGLHALEGLEGLAVWAFRRRRSGDLGAPPGVTTLRLVGRGDGSAVDLDVLPRALSDLTVEDVAVGDLSGMRATPDLTRLWVHGPEGPVPGPELDLRPLASAAGLRFVSVIGHAGASGAEEVLSALPHIQSFAVSGLEPAPALVRAVSHNSELRLDTSRGTTRIVRIGSAFDVAGPCG